MLRLLPIEINFSIGVTLKGFQKNRYPLSRGFLQQSGRRIPQGNLINETSKLG
jgi:hypothetical protein